MLNPDPNPQNEYYGHFATMSRLITTMVCENMLHAYFMPILSDDMDNDMRNDPHGGTLTGFCFLTTLSDKLPGSNFRLEYIYAFAALRGVPELDPNDSIDIKGRMYSKIVLLHPWDILPYIYGPADNTFLFQIPDAPNLDSSFLHDADYIRDKVHQILAALGLKRRDLAKLKDGYDSIRLWNRYVYHNNVSLKVADMCTSWFKNSSKFQTHIYNHPNPLPSYLSTPTHWEHCVMEGHPLFPISRTVKSYPPLPPLTPNDFTNLLQHTKMRLVAIPMAHLEILGDFEARTRNLVNCILEKNGDVDELRKTYKDHVFVPVHDLQVPNIREKIQHALILPEEHHVLAYGLSSIRTVAVPGTADGQTIKLSLGIELASIMRTIPPRSAIYGYRFSTQIVPKLSYHRDILTIQTESACAYYRDADPEVSKHLCCIVRDSEEIRTTATSDGFAVCAALVEKIQRPDTSQTLVKHVWNLDTEQKRTQFLDSYIRLFFTAIIPPCRDNGIAFECHAQNTILRFDRISGDLKGFMIRDLCDMQVHRETAVKIMGQEVEDLFPEDAYNYAATLEQVYIFLYYGAIYVHLQTLIRVLDMHHDGSGWEIARKHFKGLVSQEHPMYGFFMLRDQIPIRSYTRTRLMNTTINSAFFDSILKPNLLLSGMRATEGADRILQTSTSEVPATPALRRSTRRKAATRSVPEEQK